MSLKGTLLEGGGQCESEGDAMEGGGQCESEGDAIGGRWTMRV